MEQEAKAVGFSCKFIPSKGRHGDEVAIFIQ